MARQRVSKVCTKRKTLGHNFFFRGTSKVQISDEGGELF